MGIRTKMSNQPRPSISNIFGGGEEAAANVKRQSTQTQGSSDIFNQTPSNPMTPNTGKKLYTGQRDNDIFGIRERTTGEITQVNEAQLQASTSTVHNAMR